ncbi:MAG: glycosyltransferase family 2 protein [Phycisphaerales bacterium]
MTGRPDDRSCCCCASARPERAAGAARVLVAIPTFNEEKYVERVLERVLRHTPSVLVIDDGSSDSTPCMLPKFPVEVIRHAENRGYGRSLLDAFRWAGVDGYDWVITMDCDEQHEPEAIPRFVEAIERADRDEPADIISGSRYMPSSERQDAPPANRRAINATITGEINECLGLNITDAFCGFKAYRVSAIRELELTETGYAFPMQFWAQAVACGLRIREIPVRLIYNDPNRTFGGPLNDDAIRLSHYREVLHRSMEAARLACGEG